MSANKDQEEEKTGRGKKCHDLPFKLSNSPVNILSCPLTSVSFWLMRTHWKMRANMARDMSTLWISSGYSKRCPNLEKRIVRCDLGASIHQAKKADGDPLPCRGCLFEKVEAGHLK